ncbi:MAG: IclR family transcriptional regulator [Phycisphaerales bacterium]|nr:IclR family transcriptional regulator [Phycisphaerales bacterium]
MPRSSSADPRRSGADPKYPVPALDKGLDILELLAERPDGLTQAEVARSLGRSVGEIFRMLNALLRRGYLALDPHSDRYLLTLRLFELAHRHAPMNRLIWNALPVMKDLSAEIRQSCHLAVLEQRRAVVVTQVDSPDEVCFAVRVGRDMDPLDTASGRVLLAFSSDGKRDELLEELPARPRAAASSRLEQIRRRGYEQMPSTRIRGVHDVSVPVVGFGGGVVAALTVPCIESIGEDRDTMLEEVVAAVRRAGVALSRSIGGAVVQEESPS